MQSGSHRAAIMLKTACVVISNDSKLQIIENASQDLIHCKMQGTLNGKTMHVVYASFVLFSLESSTQLYNHYRIVVEDNSVKCMPLDAFFGIQILPNSISAGLRPGPSWGSLRRFPRPPIVGSPTVHHHFSEPSAAPALQQRAAGLLLSTRRAVDIDRLLLPDAELPAAAAAGPKQQVRAVPD